MAIMDSSSKLPSGRIADMDVLVQRNASETRGTPVTEARLLIAISGAFVSSKRIVAVGLLTADDVKTLGPAFDRLWPIDETPLFSELLRAIDEADRQLWQHREGDHEGSGP